jgi:hypothetical protein
MTADEAYAHVEAARHIDDYAYAHAVADVLDTASRLRWWPWSRRRSLSLFQVVADLDIDDKVISLAVDEARKYLEARGVACEPSSDKSYDAYLANMPPFERHLMLARQSMTMASGKLSPRMQRKVLRNAIRHFELAGRHGTLSQRQQKTLAALRGRVGVA